MPPQSFPSTGVALIPGGVKRRRRPRGRREDLRSTSHTDHISASPLLAFCFVSHCLTSCFCPRLDQNGTVQCEAISCPPPQCPAGTAPAYVKGACCKECQREWTTLNPTALLRSHNHGSARIQTTKSTSAAAGFSVSPLLHPRRDA